ncbi:hypothetical protein Taro_039224 [Colocasia esculenta]|uniref:Uncharacterized protein n=1 Tax=Colocasia esculenta TaxID=4460 RepID=A0A843W8R8_COLES|nr:hypothetical protein [Colocasia esculenta]
MKKKMQEEWEYQEKLRIELETMEQTSDISSYVSTEGYYQGLGGYLTYPQYPDASYYTGGRAYAQSTEPIQPPLAQPGSADPGSELTDLISFGWPIRDRFLGSTSFYTFLETVLVTLALLPHFIAFFSDSVIPGSPGTLATTFLSFVANTTTIEASVQQHAYEKKRTSKWRFDLGRRKNFEQVFGTDKKYWFIPAYSEEDLRKMPALQGLQYPSKPDLDAQEF